MDFEEGAEGQRWRGVGPRSSSRLANELLRDNPPHERVENESELEKRKAEWNEICWGGNHNLRGWGGERKAYPLSHLEKAREGGGGGLHPLESSWSRSCNNEKMKGWQLGDRCGCGVGGGRKVAKVFGGGQMGCERAKIASRCMRGRPRCASMLKVEI